MTFPVTATREGARFSVRVTPRAGRTAITGLHGEGSAAALRIALHAPPVEGRANEALIDFLADLLGTRRSEIEIAGGRQARTKVILVRAKTASEVAARIEAGLR
ncbi:MAG TPA: DUF167 domain-containing protein [Acidobacteriaceae bacterium]|jgi:hypothetical protein|nr:DUF167 domain-containing protein [Acidobacteriaceae bacterium]